MERVRRWLGRIANNVIAYGERRVLEAEASGRLPKYGRLIVVCGMARTGTSATAAFIGSHPMVHLVVGGGLWYVAETDIMKGNEVSWETIDVLLKKYPLRRILVKQPWLEENSAFFDRAEGASVIICRKESKDLFYSWIKTNMVGVECKHHPDTVYKRHESYARYLVRLGALEVWPDRDGSSMAWEIGQHLRLPFEGFELDRMERRWTNKNERIWLEENALWDTKL